MLVRVMRCDCGIDKGDVIETGEKRVQNMGEGGGDDITVR